MLLDTEKGYWRNGTYVPFRNESLAFQKMMRTAKQLCDGNFGTALSDYAFHRHTDECVMLKPTDDYEYVRSNRDPVVVPECQTMLDLQERYTKELSQLREMAECDSLQFTAQITGFGLSTEVIEDSPHIVPKGEYYSRDVFRDAFEYNEYGYGIGKPHGVYRDIKVKETGTRMVGRGKKRHEETYQYERTIGHEPCFSEQKYERDNGYGFIQDAETRLVPDELKVRLAVHGKYVRGWTQVTFPYRARICGAGEKTSDDKAQTEIQELGYQPFFTNDFRIDPNAVLEKARMLAIEHEVKNGNNQPTTPEESELIEDGYVQQAETALTEKQETQPDLTEPIPETQEDIQAPSQQPEPTTTITESLPKPTVQPQPEPAIEPLTEPQSEAEPLAKPQLPEPEVEIPKFEEPLGKVTFENPILDFKWSVEMKPLRETVADTIKAPVMDSANYEYRRCLRCGFKTRQLEDCYCCMCGKPYIHAAPWASTDTRNEAKPQEQTPKGSLVYRLALFGFKVVFRVSRLIEASLWDNAYMGALCNHA